MRYSIYFLVFFSLASCNSNANLKNTSLPSNNLERWLNYYQLDLHAFVDSLPLEELKTIDSYYEYDSTSLYKELFVFSPDSTNFIDLDSYSLNLQRNSKGELISLGGEIDTEVALINKSQKRRTRILFCGTNDFPQEAFWLNNKWVYILGFSKTNDLLYPCIWRFEVNNHFFQFIKTQIPIDIKGKNYLESVRLKVISHD